eukprot:CAMPEP_0175043368 /NCGR_PEP_ID=MMETSP0052_2-20121109/3141_1 /TAXON_ID=51329 ORGANISM="Polytomella parva, Strain SAG 63-3" /NCGR_SAMPLE_ID=MMETSP0052_2 /ASSEMBLY_ACC=CAM_ASM_000194 /LENGTH=297 /DNA_ID=CAMNT_0016306405 /DNA_START=163 /DNA_END=1056 /DNA_ORIENTATION=-
MYASPLPSVRRALKTKSLGELNPLPFTIAFANVIAWTSYGLVTKDPYVTTPNFIGIPLTLFCSLSCFELADDRIKRIIKIIIVTESLSLSFTWVLVAFCAGSHDTEGIVWGLAGNMMAIIYYAAPLSSMVKVIKSRNSSSILVPLTLANSLNALLWTLYGFGIDNIFVWLPNLIGLVLSLAQFALRLIYPAIPRGAPIMDSSDTERGSSLATDSSSAALGGGGVFGSGNSGLSSDPHHRAAEYLKLGSGGQIQEQNLSHDLITTEGDQNRLMNASEAINLTTRTNATIALSPAAAPS